MLTAGLAVLLFVLHGSRARLKFTSSQAGHARQQVLRCAARLLWAHTKDEWGLEACRATGTYMQHASTNTHRTGALDHITVLSIQTCALSRHYQRWRLQTQGR